MQILSAALHGTRKSSLTKTLSAILSEGFFKSLTKYIMQGSERGGVGELTLKKRMVLRLRHSSGRQEIWVSFPDLTQVSCAPQVGHLNLSVPQLLHMHNRDNKTSCLSPTSI